MLALMGNLGAKSPVAGLMPEVHFLPFPYHYRQPFGIKDPEEADTAVMKYIETALNDDESGIPKPACVGVEAIQGEGGVQPMSPWALRELRRITMEADIPLILDEVQAGFCRSGKFFAFQHSETGADAPKDVHGQGAAEKCQGVGAPAPNCGADTSCGSCSYAGIEPDVVCVSKAVGGSMPMACISFTEELNKWAPAAHTGTFRGNQIAFATGAAGIKFMKENRLWEAAAQKGEWLRARMEALQQELPFIGDVRGRGLMMGVELIQPGTEDHTGVPLPFGALAAATQKCAFHENKLIIEKGGRQGAVLRFLPPLTVEQDELERGVDLMEDSLRKAAAQMTG
jgi:diaminobutyrate-2-oxoglutarate transaminase